MKGRTLEYYNLMLNMLCQMLVYPDLTKHGVEIETLIKYAAQKGVSGIVKIGDKWKCGKLSWASVKDDNGIADRCVLTGTDWTLETDTDKVAYFRNYYLQNPEDSIKWFACQFADIDLAQRTITRHCKYTPIPVASNYAEQKQYELALARNISGEDITVMLRPQSNRMLVDSTFKEDDKVLNLNDPAIMEKMHFASEYHAEIKKRFGTMYGMCFKSSSKSAQESIDEIHGLDNFSLIIPHMKLKELKLFANKCKKLWGFEGEESVDFSELWKRENISAYNETVLKEGQTQETIEEDAEGETETEKEGEKNDTDSKADSKA